MSFYDPALEAAAGNDPYTSTSDSAIQQKTGNILNHKYD